MINFIFLGEHNAFVSTISNIYTNNFNLNKSYVFYHIKDNNIFIVH